MSLRAPTLEIDESERAMQHLAPQTAQQRFEGIAFSPCGNTIAVATSDADTVFLFRRADDGRFESAPYAAINGPDARLHYPHDLSFARYEDKELLAVAQRTGSICIYARDRTQAGYGTSPVFEIQGPYAELEYTDGVAFVPPENEYLAACNLTVGRLTFYRKVSDGGAIRFNVEPAFVLTHKTIYNPDGLGFSNCGNWLAVANHGAHTVSIFRRAQNHNGDISYGPRPASVIRDPGLRYPHSAAFTPDGNYLVVTNAGANYFNVYRCERKWFRTVWGATPVLRKIVGPERVFHEVNGRNKMEGGPKGVAIHKSEIAVCSPEHGIKIYPYQIRTS